MRHGHEYEPLQLQTRWRGRECGHGRYLEHVFELFLHASVKVVFQSYLLLRDLLVRRGRLRRLGCLRNRRCHYSLLRRSGLELADEDAVLPDRLFHISHARHHLLDLLRPVVAQLHRVKFLVVGVQLGHRLVACLHLVPELLDESVDFSERS